MKLAWRLLIRSGKSNWSRLGLTAAAVAFGVLILLTFTVGVSALINRNTQHVQWRYDIHNPQEITTKPINGVAPLKATIATDGNLNKWHNENITTVSLRATDDTSPQLKDLPTPKDGEYYVSQGLDAVMRAHPEVRIGERYGTKQIGVIPEHLSASPDALEVIRGMSAQEASSQHVVSVYRFTTRNASIFSGDVGMILIFGATILLFPIVTFISIATQLGSAQREKRYAAMRLIGATRRQVMHIIVVESLVAAVAGVIVGSLAYLAVLPLMAGYQLDDMRFWPSDLTIPLAYYVLVIGLTLALCLYANWKGMRQVQLSPLGVVRSGKLAKQPRIWRLILLIPGIATFVWLALPQGAEWVRLNSTNTAPLLLLIAGVTSIMAGLLLAGPWLTSSIARIAARRTRNATTLLASKRITLQSKRIFRSVSGVVLALFAGSFYLTCVSGIDSFNVSGLNNNGYSQLRPNTAFVSSAALPEDFASSLDQLPYVVSVQAVDALSAKGDLIPCVAVATYTQHKCPEGSQATDNVLLNFEAPVVKAVTIEKTDLQPHSKDYLVLLDSNDNLDQLRTFVAAHTGINTPSWVVSGTYAQIPIINPVIKELGGLAYVGMAITLFAAIASLIVSTIGGLLERKRSFATLRLGGMTSEQMKRTVMIESLIPLVSVSLISAGLGVWVGWVFIGALSTTAEPTLTPLYFAIVGGSLIIAAFAIRLILPLLDSMTKSEANQTE